MISRWRWVLALLTRRLWFRAAIFGVAAFAAALIAALAAPLIPASFSSVFGADSVQDILKILASSMLAVATFSLGTMVSAFSAAASMATPRASKLLIEDPTSQNVLSTFIGVFVFSLVGIIALNTHFYGEGGRAILFLVTLVIVAMTLATFFRWIDYLSNLGRLGETIGKVEKSAAAAMRARLHSPFLGCQPEQEVPPRAFALASTGVGYVQFLDVEALNAIAEDAGGTVHVMRLPGAFVDPTEPLVWTTWQPDAKQRDRLRGAFLIDAERSFELDPRFGMIVLAEIASRALSPGINDPGTAIDIIGRAVRVLSICAEDPGEEACDIVFPHVFIPAIRPGDLFDDAFTPIARDGAGIVEVGIRLQKAFRSLARTGVTGFAENARRHAALANARSTTVLALDEDRRVLQRLAAEVDDASAADSGSPGQPDEA